MFTTLVAKLVTHCQAVTELSQANQVFDHEPSLEEITTDPFATVCESGNESAFASTSENRRTYAYTIRVFVERRSQGADTADSVLRSILTSLLNRLDDDYTLSSSVLTSRAAPSSWGYVLGTKEYRVGTIEFTCIADYSLTP